MFGILLLILLAIFFAGKSNPQAPSYPPPPPKAKEDKTLKIIIIVIVVIVLLVILVPAILAAVLYGWVSGMAPSGGGTPYCILSASTSGTESGKTQVNVTWMVISPSRADIKWSDIPQASAKVYDDGVVISSPTFLVWPSGTYVTGGNTITVTLTRATVTSGSIIKLVLVHAPSGGTFGESSGTLTYTTSAY